MRWTMTSGAENKEPCPKRHRKEAHNNNGGLTLVPVGSRFRQLAEFIATYILSATPWGHVDIVEPFIGLRSNGEPYYKLGEKHIAGHDVVVLGSGPGTYQTIVDTLMVLRYVAARRPRRVATALGYGLLTRSDKPEGTEELALLNFMMRMLEEATLPLINFIIVADPHPFDHFNGFAQNSGRVFQMSFTKQLLCRVLADARREHPHNRVRMVYPDKSAGTRYKAAQLATEAEFGCVFPVVIGDKERRDSANSTLTSVTADPVTLSETLDVILDDEGATFGSVDHIAGYSLKHGAALCWSATVHGVLCGGATELLASPACNVQRAYITNSIPVLDRPGLSPLIESGRLRVVSWDREIAQLIHNYHWDNPLYPLR